MAPPKGFRWKQTPEAKEKIRLAKLGSKHSPETLAKLRKAKLGKKGSASNGFKRGFTISNGYKLVLAFGHPHANNNGYVLEHHLVMEKHLGRFTKKGEIVHHIDGDKLNNSIDNLMLFPNQSSHIKHHKETSKIKWGLNKRYHK